MPDPVLFTSDEAAKALGVDRRTIVRWVRSGRMNVNRVLAGARVFTAEEVARVAALPKLRRGRPRKAPQNTELPEAPR